LLGIVSRKEIEEKIPYFHAQIPSTHGMLPLLQPVNNNNKLLIKIKKKWI
jgi:hypothetical protein